MNLIVLRIVHFTCLCISLQKTSDKEFQGPFRDSNLTIFQSSGDNAQMTSAGSQEEQQVFAVFSRDMLPVYVGFDPKR